MKQPLLRIVDRVERWIDGAAWTQERVSVAGVLHLRRRAQVDEGRRPTLSPCARARPGRGERARDSEEKLDKERLHVVEALG